MSDESLNPWYLPEKKIPVEQVKAAEARLFQTIDSLESDEKRRASVRKMRYRWLAAAAVIVLIAAGWLVVAGIGHGHAPEEKTAYGQVKYQRLPDGSDVTMNANSQLRYSSDWKEGQDREVWVNGEAFFHVSRTAAHSRFIVHATHFDIIVTGTQFNVVNRHGRDNVLLQEGSVLLRTSDGRTLSMSPGDFVAYDTFLIQQRNLRPDSVLAWKEQKLVLDRTPLRDLVTIIGDHYGVPVMLADDSLGDHPISAILPNNNLDILLKALGATGDFDIDRSFTGDSITIRTHR